ncbi:MAG: peptidoglycan editing factor PgeF [Myxococcales bacterium]
MLLTASRFTATHGFSTREGGVSEGPLASLNLGRAVGDAPDNVQQNARRLAQAAGLPVRALVTVKQVHGDAVHDVVRGGEADAFGDPQTEADAMVTRTPGLALCIQTADCVPVLLHAPDVHAVGAAHAGWRGTILDIAGATVRRLVAFGAQPEAMQAVIGPAIHRCCYEVDEALAQRFADRFGAEVVLRGERRPHLDLVEANRRALLGAGLSADRIEAMPHCTSCDRRFFSHRRDEGRSGRQISFVAL